MVFPAAARALAASASLADELPYWGWIDRRTALTVGAELVTMGELTPFSPAGEPRERIDAVIGRWTRMLSACPPSARVYVFALRRPADLRTKTAGPPVAVEAQTAREDYLSRRVESLRTYVAWSHEARVRDAAVPSKNGGAARAASALDAVKKIAKRVAREFQDRAAQRDIQVWLRESIERECERVRMSVDALAAMVADVTPIRMLEADEASSVLGELVNRPGYQPVGAPVESLLSWWLARSTIEVERRSMRIDGEDVVVYSLLAPPLDIAAGALDGVAAIRGSVTVAWEWRPQEQSKAKARIVSAQRHFFQRQYSALAHATDSAGTEGALKDSAAEAEVQRLADARIELESEGIAYGELAVTLTLHGPLEMIERHDADLHRVFAQSDAKLIRESFGQPSSYFGRLPGQPRGRQVRSVLVSAAVAGCMAPLYGPSQGSRTSAHLGAPSLATLETQIATPYHYDLFEGDVGHTVILGATGSGKSFLANFLLLSAMKYEPRICILDLGGSYRGLTELVGGSYLALSPEAGETPRVAPFSLPEGERSLRFLSSWVLRLLRIGGYEATADDLNDIRDRIADLYQAPVQDRTLSALVLSLNHKMWSALARWHGSGAWAPIFDHAPDDWNVADWQVVDLAGAAEHEDLCEAALAFFLERLRLAVDGDDSRTRLKILMVDEAWRFLRDAETAAWLMEAARTWRKRNAALILATQSTGDLAGPEVAALLGACPTKIFLANPTFAREHADQFGLEPHETDIVRQLVPKSELYRRRPHGGEILRLSVDARSYWLCTSNAREAEKRARLVEEHGLRRALDILSASEGVPA